VKERKVLENKEIEGPSPSVQVTIERRALDPWILYLYAMKSPAATKVFNEIRKILNFLNLLGGTLKDKSRAFADRGRNDNARVFNSILKIIQLLK